jgi:hypothetical protein
MKDCQNIKQHLILQTAFPFILKTYSEQHTSYLTIYRMTSCHNLTFSRKYLYRRCLASWTVIRRPLVFHTMNQETIFLLCYGKNSISHLHFKFSCISRYKQITLIAVCYVPFIPWSPLSLEWLKSPYTNETPIPVGMSLWTHGFRLYGNMLLLDKSRIPARYLIKKSGCFTWYSAIPIQLY